MASIKVQEGKRGITYRVTVSNGYDRQGKKIRKTATFIPDPERTEKQNQKALERFAYEFEKAVLDGTYYNGNHLTLSELSEKWLCEYVKEQLTPKTYANYKDMLEKHILPYIGHYKISKLKPLHIQELWNYLKNNDVRADGKKGGLGSVTIRKCHAALSKMLACAVQWQLIDSNPCEKVSKPKADKTVKRDNFFTPEQALTFLDALEREYITEYKGHTRTDDTGKPYTVKDYTEARAIPLKYRVFFHIALYGGLRCGEVLGLTFNDVDFENNTVYVCKSVSYVNKQTIVKEPKNKTSIRTVTLPAPVMKIIKQLKQEQRREQLRLGTYWSNEQGYLFTQDNGSLMFYSTPYAEFKKIIKLHNEQINASPQLTPEEKEALQLPNITLHGLRHTSATLLISQNIDIRTVSARLGHAQTSTTMNIYAHALQSLDQTAADALSNVLAH